MFDYLVQTNYAAFITSIFMLVFILLDRSFSKRVVRLFLYAVVVTLLLILADAVDYWQATMTEPTLLRTAAACMGYILRPLALCFIVRIVRRDSNKSLVGKILTAAPLIINTAVVLLSCFFGFVFSFSPSNAFLHGPLWLMPFVVSAFYMGYMLVAIVQQSKHNGKHELPLIFIIAGICTVSTVLESKFNYRFLLNATIATSIVFYYLYLHVQIYTRDALTNLLNRRNFYLDAVRHDGKYMVVVSIDINNLKKINDTGGHKAGDEAIRTIVLAVQRSIGKGCTMYRTGGDEFMLLCVGRTMPDVKLMLDAMYTRLASTPYSVAVGMARYCPGDDFNAACVASDENMYNNKNTMKEQQDGEN